jgi:hypothetical protein
MNLEFSYNDLKIILDNLGTPERLDDHPWINSLAVKTLVENEPVIQQKSPGFQLAVALCRIFRKMMPSTLPKHGKRLDTNWCQFGLLAAQYFAPFEFGSISPNSLRDAAGRIDHAIYLYISNKSESEISASEIDQYKVIGNECELTPVSTLSDWHTKGLHRLFELFFAYEQSLSRNSEDTKSETLLAHQDSPSSSPGSEIKNTGKSLGQQARKFLASSKDWRVKNWPKIRLGLILLLVLLLGIKGVCVYSAVKSVKNDLGQLKSLSTSDKTKLTSELQSVGPLLSSTRSDLAGLNRELSPFLWMGQGLAWVPVHGGDFAEARNLMDLATGLTTAADETYQAASPILQSLTASDGSHDLSRMANQLIKAKPQLIEARRAMDGALAAYKKIDIDRLSPKVKGLIQKIDPLIPLLDSGLSAAMVFPELTGATGDGPKTYMLLLQNEDELRATGGFITAVGTIAVENGKVLSYKIEDSYALDDPNQYYPPAPWQLTNYMESSQWFLRDANWFPDFPTSARWTEMFFAMSQSYGVDGVIAIDQQALRFLLAGLGPVKISGVAYPITSDNVIEYMRSAKSPTPSEKLDSDWWQQRKDFMQGLAQAILDRVQSGQGFSWLDFSRSLVQALNERHILAVVDDPTINHLLAERGWNGAIQTNGGDYLLIVDSNLGFNKVNAVVKESLSYSVDLTDLQAPTSILEVNNQNDAAGNPLCSQKADYGDGSYTSLINRCYWDYLRVYSRADAVFVKSNPKAIPGKELLGGNDLPAQTDDLTDENNETIKGYGTLFVVSAGGVNSTSYQFDLSPAIYQTSGKHTTYSLKVQKQAGTLAIPIKITITLPPSASLIQASLTGEQSGNNWVFTSDLRQDLNFTITFSSK